MWSGAHRLERQQRLAAEALANTSGSNGGRNDPQDHWCWQRPSCRATALAEPAAAQNEQFVPTLSYRTGAYAVNGIPFANGVVRLLDA